MRDISRQPGESTKNSRRKANGSSLRTQTDGGAAATEAGETEGAAAVFTVDTSAGFASRTTVSTADTAVTVEVERVFGNDCAVETGATAAAA